MFEAMKPTRALRVVGAWLQAVGRVDVPSVVDAIAAQVILTVSVPVGGAAALRCVRLAHTIQTRCRATLTDVIADFAAVAVSVRGAFDAAAVGVTHQTIRALGVVATRYAAVTAADRATRAVGAALATQDAGVGVLIAGQRSRAIPVTQTLNASPRLSIADIAGWTTRSVGKTPWCAVVFVAGLAAVTGVVVTTSRNALAVLTAGVVAAA